MPTALPLLGRYDMANPLMKPGLIRLTHKDQDSKVLVETGDDRFMLTVPEAVDACLSRDEHKELIARRDLFEHQMRLLWAKLKEWADEHSVAIREAWFQIRPECQMFLVVLRATEYSPEIETSLTDLTIEVANDPAFSMTRLDVQALPNCSPDDIRSFIDAGIASENGGVPVAR
jgi:hypothetical protein